MTHSSLALVLTFTAAGTLFAQQAVFRARTDVVAIDVSVMDGTKPVTSLTISDFRLTDDGVAQTLIDVGREPMPLRRVAVSRHPRLFARSPRSCT